MRGDIIYEVVAIGTDSKTGNRKDPSVFNTSRTREEAEEKQAALLSETNWAGTGKSYKAYWDDFVIREKIVDTDFEIPGSKYWTAEDEQPSGQYGFVWGCHWGDDSSWKVQYLDLSEIRNGVITRDERFGYLELATDKGPASDFIQVDEGRVKFKVEKYYSLNGRQLGVISKDRFLEVVRKQFAMSDLSEIIPAAEWIYDNLREANY